MKNFLNYFTTIDTVSGIKVILLVCFMAFFEVAGIASIMPFLGFIVDPETFMKNEIFKYFVNIIFGDDQLSIKFSAIFLGTFSM